MKMYVICMMHKRTLNYFEVLKVFKDRTPAELHLIEVNKGRPLYSQYILKEYQVEA